MSSLRALSGKETQYLRCPRECCLDFVVNCALRENLKPKNKTCCEQ